MSDTVLGIALLVMSIFLVIAVLMQSGKSKRLSGTIAGGAETFFGKEKSRSIDAVLSKVTTVVAILFIIVTIVVYVLVGTDPVEVTPGAPVVVESQATTPEATQPEATQPEAAEPEAAEPEVTEPEATQPEAAEPEAAEPEATQPEATESTETTEDNTVTE